MTTADQPKLMEEIATPYLNQIADIAYRLWHWGWAKDNTGNFLSRLMTYY